MLAVDTDPSKARRLAGRYRGYPQVSALVARPDQLPVLPCTVKVVLVGDWLAQPPSDEPINEHLAHGQISRALDHDGWVGGWQIARDDTVPWVQRLLTLLRSVDPEAMKGGVTNHESVLTSKYFPVRETREFRLWVPITPASLQAGIAAMPAVTRLDGVARVALLDEIEQVFTNAAGFGDLRLPYRISCWRARVDHEELTTPITISDGALVIPI